MRKNSSSEFTLIIIALNNTDGERRRVRLTLSAYKRHVFEFIARNVFDGIIILAERTQKLHPCFHISNSQLYRYQQIWNGFRQGFIKINLKVLNIPFLWNHKSQWKFVAGRYCKNICPTGWTITFDRWTMAKRSWVIAWIKTGI